MNLATICVGCMANDTGDAICPKCGSPFDLPPKNTLQLKPRSMLRDQYLIGRALGHGGFGITYLAWDLGLEARLAIKEYMPNGVAGRASGETKVSAYSDQTRQEFEWGLGRFLDEARTLKKFSNHPGIVSVDTIFRENGTAYLVMEYLDGWTLEEFLRKRDGKIGFETALRILTPVLDALTAVHAEGILHRDISPDNIYLTRTGKVKLIDFGAARNALSQKSRNLSIILKEGYAPEEQYRASGIQGPWTDVYAVAATLYHAITGQAPQPSLDRMAEDRVLPPTRLGAEIAPNIEAAIMKALAIKAQDRFQSAEDFKSALEGQIIVEAPRPISHHSISGHPAAPPDLPPPPAPISAHTPPPMPPPAPAPAKPRWILPAAFGIVALAAVAWVSLRVPHPVPTGPSGSSSDVVGSGASGAAGAPTGPSAGPAPTGPTTQPTGPAGPTSADVVPGPTGPTAPPPDPTGRRPRNQEPRPAGPTGAPAGSTSAPAGASGSPYGSTSYPTGPAAGPAGPTTYPAGPESGPPSGNGDNTVPFQDYPQPGPSNNRPGNSGDYNGLLEQAKNAWSSRNFAMVQQLLTRAIQIDPNNPRAYSGLGELNLYIFNNPGLAMQNYQAAIARGGEAVFHVMHDHSADSFVTHCQGYLRISANTVRYQPVPQTVHAFQASKAQIREARNNRELSLNFKRGRIQFHSFHIRLNDGQNFNFAGESRSDEAERQMILAFIGR
jgi:serine/threonine protein kinase